MVSYDFHQQNRESCYHLRDCQIFPVAAVSDLCLSSVEPSDKFYQSLDSILNVKD